MKILYITTIGNTMDFFINLINQLVCDGHRVDIACNAESKLAKEYSDLGCSVFHLDCSRSPLSKGNLFCVGQIRKIVEDNKYDIVHCHTPIAAACTRVACRNLRKKGLRVFYTAHGFHFYKGAPLKNWMIYYPIEWLLSWYTDVLIVINREDYKRAKKKLHVKKAFYIPGVGVDIERFSGCCINKEQKRMELKIPKEAFVLLSVGELQDRKNQRVVIEALHIINNSNIYYLCVGQGELKDEYCRLIHKYKLQDNIMLLGYRTDIEELCKAVDCFVHPSVREGLGIAPLEAMASGLPLISANINGIKDYTKEGYSGCCVNPESLDEMKQAIIKMYSSKAFCRECGANNMKTAKKYGVDRSNKKMLHIYLE